MISSEATPRAEHVEQASASDVQRSVGKQKRRLQIRELLIRDRNIPLNRGDGDGQRLTIEIADRNRDRYEDDRQPPVAVR